MAKNGKRKPAIFIGEKHLNFEGNLKKKTDNLREVMIEICCSKNI